MTFPAGAAEAVVARAARCLQSMQTRDLAGSRKEGFDIVTAADLAAEQILLDGLRALTPEAGFLSEEAGASGPGRGESGRWIIDPLDGTVNYASGLPWFSVTVAYQEAGSTRFGLVQAPAAGLMARYQDGAATIDGAPARVSDRGALGDATVSVLMTSHFSDADMRRTVALVGRLAPVTRGVRIVVSGALELCYVASGRLDAWISLRADVVSHAAAMPMVRAGGGRVTRLDGHDAADDDPVRIASNGHLHDALLAVVRAGA